MHLVDRPVRPGIETPTLATLERRAGEETAAARCLDEARGCFLALADATGLGYLAGHAEPLLSLDGGSRVRTPE